MGQQLSQCGNAQACFDVNDARMELRDSPDAPEQLPRSALAYGRACSHGAHGAQDDRGGQAQRVSPRGPVGRNHSVHRSFGGSSPSTPRGGGGGGSAAMLEELRNMYSASAGRPHTEAASLAEKIVRDRERANGGGDGRDGHRRTDRRELRDLGHEEDALVRSALDVVAQRYVNEGLASTSRPNGLLSASRSTPLARDRPEQDPRDSRRMHQDLGPQVGCPCANILLLVLLHPCCNAPVAASMMLLTFPRACVQAQKRHSRSDARSHMHTHTHLHTHTHVLHPQNGHMHVRRRNFRDARRAQVLAHTGTHRAAAGEESMGVHASPIPAPTIAPGGAGEATSWRFGGMGTTRGPHRTMTKMTTVTPILVPPSLTRGLCRAPRSLSRAQEYIHIYMYVCVCVCVYIHYILQRCEARAAQSARAG